MLNNDLETRLVSNNIESRILDPWTTHTHEGRGECFESRRKWDNKNPFVSLKRMITTKLPVG